MEKSQELFLVILLYQKKILGWSFQNKQKNKILLELKQVRVFLLCLFYKLLRFIMTFDLLFYSLVWLCFGGYGLLTLCVPFFVVLIFMFCLAIPYVQLTLSFFHCALTGFTLCLALYSLILPFYNYARLCMA